LGRPRAKGNASERWRRAKLEQASAFARRGDRVAGVAGAAKRSAARALKAELGEVCLVEL
jgi:hypothetical protein